MHQIIQNSQWYAQADDTRAFFQSTGAITYDSFCLCNYRTCSISNTQDNDVAIDQYEPYIDLYNQRFLTFGYRIRAIDAQQICLLATFYDENKNEIETIKEDITNRIQFDFQDVAHRFYLPYQASYVRLSIAFYGKITACTFFAPFAYFS